MELLTKFNERLLEVRERAMQIRELIERAKTEAEPGLLEVLEQWERANNRILEKYPEGAEMDFQQLDLQDNEIEFRKQKGLSSKAVTQTDEMQEFLKVIQSKQ